MLSAVDTGFISMCLKGFLYGNISILCTVTCTLANEVQIFAGLGLYSGIFAIYLQCHFKEPRTSTFVLYVLSLLYALSAATVAISLLTIILEVSNNSESICKNIIFYQLLLCGRFISVHYCLNFKSTTSQCYFALILSKAQYSVVVTSSPNVSWYA